MSNTRCQLNGELHTKRQINSSVSTGNMDEMFLKQRRNVINNRIYSATKSLNITAALTLTKRFIPLLCKKCKAFNLEITLVTLRLGMIGLQF